MRARRTLIIIVALAFTTSLYLVYLSHASAKQQWANHIQYSAQQLRDSRAKLSAQNRNAEAINQSPVSPLPAETSDASEEELLALYDNYRHEQLKEAYFLERAQKRIDKIASLMAPHE